MKTISISNHLLFSKLHCTGLFFLDKYGPYNWEKHPIEEIDNDRSTYQQLLSKAEKRRLKEKYQLELTETYTKENNKRAVYPVDLWFLISKHLMPEQVKCFSMICKGTQFVTSTKQFWLNLYNR